MSATPPSPWAETASNPVKTVFAMTRDPVRIPIVAMVFAISLCAILVAWSQPLEQVRVVGSATDSDKEENRASKFLLYPNGTLVIVGTLAQSNTGKISRGMFAREAVKFPMIYSEKHARFNSIALVRSPATGEGIAIGGSIHEDDWWASTMAVWFLAEGRSEPSSVQFRRFNGVEMPGAGTGITALENGEIVVAGYGEKTPGMSTTGSPIQGQRVVRLVKLDSNLKLKWDKLYPVGNDATARAVRSLAGGKIAVVGSTRAPVEGFLMMVNSDTGGTDWVLRWSDIIERVERDVYKGSAKFSREGSVEFNDVRPLAGGRLVVTGSIRKSDSDLFVATFDRVSGKLLWAHTCGGTRDDEGLTVAALPDGGVVVGGRSESKGRYGPLWVMRLDNDGYVLWDVGLGGQTTGPNAVKDLMLPQGVTDTKSGYRLFVLTQQWFQVHELQARLGSATSRATRELQVNLVEPSFASAKPNFNHEYSRLKVPGGIGPTESPFADLSLTCFDASPRIHGIFGPSGPGADQQLLSTNIRDRRAPLR
jgi:hypothetical protein